MYFIARYWHKIDELGHDEKLLLKVQLFVYLLMVVSMSYIIFLINHEVDSRINDVCGAITNTRAILVQLVDDAQQRDITRGAFNDPQFAEHAKELLTVPPRQCKGRITSEEIIRIQRELNEDLERIRRSEGANHETGWERNPSARIPERDSTKRQRRSKAQHRNGPTRELPSEGA